MIIAVDGPAGAGKGTLARRIAETYNLAYLDTGALYRGVGLHVLDMGADPEDVASATHAAKNLDIEILDSPQLRTEDAGEAASKVAAIPQVRAALLEFQREFAQNPMSKKGEEKQYIGSILDGRDIGTVVCPKADLKLFITASAEERARRRTLELQAKGHDAIHEHVLLDILARDERDRDRATAPMVQAKDAVVLDTTHLNADEVFDRVVKLLESKLGVKKPQ